MIIVIKKDEKERRRKCTVSMDGSRFLAVTGQLIGPVRYWSGTARYRTGTALFIFWL